MLPSHGWEESFCLLAVQRLSWKLIAINSGTQRDGTDELGVLLGSSEQHWRFE